MKIACFVPIKLNSERLPNKMTLPINNTSMYEYIFNTLLQVQCVIPNMKIYCYCSDEYLEKKLDDNVIFIKRPTSLDSNDVKGIDIYQSFCKKIDADIYALCHATSPFIKKESIIEGLNKVLFENYDSSFAVSKIQTFCWFNNKPLNYNLNNVVKTQDITSVYFETSAFYIFKKNILTEHNRRIGFNPCQVITDKIESIDIDEKEDYDLACLVYDNS
jgi:CMP-N-acetylneuraminic acid synthetase